MKNLLLPFLTLAFLSSAVSAGEESSSWLMRINDAARDLNYSGTFVYLEGNKIDTMRVLHKVNDGNMQQRLYSLNGEPREVIRDDEQVWCYIPDKKLGVHEYRQVSKQGFPNILPEDLERLTRHYEIKLGRLDRVVNRPAQQIMVVPKDEYRYGYDLWADQESGLLLRAALLDSDMKPLEQYLFTEVTVGADIHEHELEPMTPASELLWYGNAQSSNKEEVSEEMPEGSWTIGEVPEGFSLNRQIKRRSSMGSDMLEHYVYSDGLASISVFVEPIGDGEASRIEGGSRMGAMHAFGRRVGDHQVTVVGEVPARTVDMMGMSVTRTQ